MGKEKGEEPPAEEDAPMEEEEEKEICFFKKSTPDLTPGVVAASFTKWTTPEAEEGFDDIRYAWLKGDKAAAYLKKWVTEKKLVTRVDDIKVGQDFTTKQAEFTKLLKEWQEKLKTFKASGSKKKKEGEEDDDVDFYTVIDVNDVGNGAPLFEHFTFEDWELVKLRFEFAALIWSFKKDTGDADRVGIPLDHLNFYYNRYFKRAINHKAYGVTDVKETMAFIKDTAVIKDGNMLVGQLTDDLDNFDIFVKLAEEGRRER